MLFRCCASAIMQAHTRCTRARTLTFVKALVRMEGREAALSLSVEVGF